MSRLATRAFDIAYEGTPSWETGRVQPEVDRLLAAGLVGGSVLDAGCGTGLHAVHVAMTGRRVAAIDVAPGAIERARARAMAEGVALTLVAADVLDLAAHAAALAAPFDTVLDVGCFHVLQPDERTPYARQLAAVTRRGGTLLLVAWSDRNPFGRGPSRIRRRDIRDAFRLATGWHVDRIDPGILESNLEPGWVHAWVARVTRR